ncbi:hypothetical protein Hte_001234 [Hypoxylon texense]
MHFPSASSYSAKATQTRASLANAFSSWDNLKLSLQVKDTLAGEQTRYVDADPLWVNEDLEPTPPEKRTWGTKTYVLFYFGLAFGNWNLGSTMIGIGLSWWQAIIVIFVSQLIAALAMIFNSRAASVYHIGYPAVCRAVFGMYGSYYFVGARAILAVVWYGLQQTKGDVNHKLQHTSVATSTGWAIMHAINSGLGNTATLITNQPDIARWSKKHRSAIWSQLVKPFAVTISATFGILATAGINGKWGLELWNPWDLLDAIQDHHNSSGARFAIFLAALTWTVGILGTNIAANMISFGSDVAMLFPRYVDMKRGFFIVEFLAFAIAPWKILASAQVFTTFLSGYGLFMASVAAIMIADYYFITNGNVFTTWLFNPRKSNIHYRYHKGWNLQALIAYVAGIALPFPGFVASLGAKGVNMVGYELYYLGWILSFLISFVLYIAICKVWPNPNQRAIREQGMRWEEASQVLLQGQDPSQKNSMEGYRESTEAAGANDLEKSNVGKD